MFIYFPLINEIFSSMPQIESKNLQKLFCPYCTDFSLLKMGRGHFMLRDMPKTFSWRLLWGDAECVCANDARASLMCQWQISSNEMESSQQGSIIILHSNSSLFYEEVLVLPTWNISKLHSFTVCDNSKVFQRILKRMPHYVKSPIFVP